MKILIDELINSWEHWENLDDDAKRLAEDLGVKKEDMDEAVSQIKSLLEYWFNNEDGFRIDFEINHYKDPGEQTESIKNLIRAKVPLLYGWQK